MTYTVTALIVAVIAGWIFNLSASTIVVVIVVTLGWRLYDYGAKRRKEDLLREIEERAHFRESVRDHSASEYRDPYLEHEQRKQKQRV